MDNEFFYTPESCMDLCVALLNAQESLKYILNCHRGEKDNKYITPELLEGYKSIADDCEEFISAYNFYINAKFWETANEEEHDARMKQYFLEIAAKKKAQKQD